MRVLRLIGVLLLLLAMPLRAVAQQEYASETRSWSFVAPAGWHQVPFERVAEISATAQSATASKAFKYIAAFSRSPSGIGTPYVLVQIQDNYYKGLSWEGIRTAGNSEVAKEAEERVTRRLAGNITFEPVIVDPARGRYVRTGTIRSGGVNLDCNLYGYLGAEKIIQFNCYSAPGQLASDQRLFDEMLVSFKFAPGKQYVPGSGGDPAVAKAEALGYATGRIVAFALIGIVVAVVGGVIKKVRGG